MVGWLCLDQKNKANCVAGCVWLAVPEPTEWQRIDDYGASEKVCTRICRPDSTASAEARVTIVPDKLAGKFDWRKIAGTEPSANYRLRTICRDTGS